VGIAISGRSPSADSRPGPSGRIVNDKQWNSEAGNETSEVTMLLQASSLWVMETLLRDSHFPQHDAGHNRREQPLNDLPCLSRYGSCAGFCVGSKPRERVLTAFKARMDQTDRSMPYAEWDAAMLNSSTNPLDYRITTLRQPCRLTQIFHNSRPAIEFASSSNRAYLSR
jgi:hypothetical protein